MKIDINENNLTISRIGDIVKELNSDNPDHLCFLVPHEVVFHLYQWLQETAPEEGDFDSDGNIERMRHLPWEVDALVKSLFEVKLAPKTFKANLDLTINAKNFEQAVRRLNDVCKDADFDFLCNRLDEQEEELS